MRYRSALFVHAGIILLLSACTLSAFNQTVTVLYPSSGKQGPSLTTLREFHIMPVELSKLRKSITRHPPGIVWFHRPDSSALSESEQSVKLISTLKNYVEEGGNLVLTMDALRWLPLLGLESREPTVTYSEARDEGYGRKLGVHAFRSHPLFDSLHGGTYLYAPSSDKRIRRMGWFGTEIPAGKTVAVDWAYINLVESSKLIAEYTLGKGKVLAIGAYICFDSTNMNRQQLSLFMKNCFSYLSNGSSTPANYWDYSPAEVRIFQPAPDSALIGKATGWLPGSGESTLRKKKAGSEPWDLAGEGMLVMGRETAGIDEIWAHPFMALRDFATGIQFEGTDSICWLDTQQPEIEVRPESFTRIYRFRRAYLKEVITCHPTEATAVVHYEYTGIPGAKLVTKFKSNLRLMWPYSENVNTLISYAWDPGIQAFRILDKTGSMVCLAGANKKPEQKLIGQYSGFMETSAVKDEKAPGDISAWFEGTSSGDFGVSGLMTFTLKPDDRLDIVFAASAEDETTAANHYRLAMLNPMSVYLASLRYQQGLMDQKLNFTTPDADFNLGYRLALTATDRFMVNTPGVGKSLVAGYATTDYGWDGGHKINGRPGYAWYFGRDGVWSSYALLDYGDFEKVRSVLEMFGKYQDISGKIFHELTTSGVAHYDAADATPLYISLAGQYLRHSGDTALIRQQWPHIRKALDFCFSTDTDGDGLIENTLVGHGWEEGGSLFGTHTTFYLASCWAEALKQATYMASALGMKADAANYAGEEGRVLQILNTKFWNPEKSFFYHGKYKNGRYHSEPDVMAAVPIGFGQIQGPEKTASVLERLGSCEFSTDWGLRIIGDDSPKYKPESYHQGSVWPLFTGWTSLAEYQDGRSSQGYSHLMNNLLTYRSWALGYVPEVLHGNEYKPFGVCSHQCWSETMVLQPAIQGMLGLQPDALSGQLTLKPAFPADWDSVSVQNIRMGNQRFSLKMLKTESMENWTFTEDKVPERMVSLNFNLDLPLGTRVQRVLVNGKEYEPQLMENHLTLHLQFNPENRGTLRVDIFRTGGVQVLPEISKPVKGMKSDDYHILSETLDGREYTVKINGRSGSDADLRFFSPQGVKPVTEGIFPIGTNGNIHLFRYRFPDADSRYVTAPLTFTLE